MIDRRLSDCAQRGRRKPQIALARRLTGWPGPSEFLGACLMRQTDASSAFRSRHVGNVGLGLSRGGKGPVKGDARRHVWHTDPAAATRSEASR